MAEAVMSAAYHICPTNSNYQYGEFLCLCRAHIHTHPSIHQFIHHPPSIHPSIHIYMHTCIHTLISCQYPIDTTMMFVLVTLGLYKLYECRNPDCHPSPHKLLITLAFLILLIGLGVVSN